MENILILQRFTSMLYHRLIFSKTNEAVRFGLNYCYYG